MIVRSHAGLFVVAGLVNACGGSAQRAGVAVRDSAGLAIVENAARNDTVLDWRLETTPLVDIGTAEGDPAHELQFASSAIRLGDGRIIVANAGTDELRAYAPDGVHLWSVGREGEGPGEFRNLGWVRRYRGDSLMTYDRSLHRLSVFTTDGEFGRIARLESRADGLSPAAVAPLEDGTVVVHASGVITPQASPGIHRLPGRLLRYSPEGEILNEIADAPGPEWVMDEEFKTLARRPFTTDFEQAVYGSRIYYGFARTWEILAADPSGATQTIIRLARSPEELTPDHVAAYQDAQLERLRRFGREDLMPRERRRVESLPYPSQLPAYRRLLTDRRGHLWVEVHQGLGGADRLFVIFDPEGGLLGRLRLPGDLEVYEIGEDYVLARWRDELDVEHVRLYRLERN